MTLFDQVEGATPINDVSGLIPDHIENKEQLNEWEANNISKAVSKYLASRKAHKITIGWIKGVHKDMFDDTWKWAGHFRTYNTNIGSDFHHIQEEVKKLADDIEYWANGNSGLSILEQSVRIHHRLVNIHPFQDGNGRHARLVADIFLFSHGQKLPDWPNDALIKKTDIRERYIASLKDADSGNFKPLIDLTAGLIH
jgi:Fic-DOC domain mobile mystery protein B